MKFENLTENQSWVRDNASRLAHLRADKLAFVYGSFQTIKAERQVYAYARSYFDEHALVVFNKSNESKTLTLELPERIAGKPLNAHFSHDASVNENQLQITMKPNSFEVILVK